VLGGYNEGGCFFQRFSLLQQNSITRTVLKKIGYNY